MNQKFYYTLLALTSSIFIGCGSSTPKSLNDSGGCDQSIEINAAQYSNHIGEQHSGVTIDNVVQDGSCLRVTYSASGCDASSWQPHLYDADEILESLPVQRNLIFVLENEEMCAAYFTKETTFDLTPLFDGESPIKLNIKNGNQSVLVKPYL